MSIFGVLEGVVYKGLRCWSWFGFFRGFYFYLFIVLVSKFVFFCVGVVLIEFCVMVVLFMVGYWNR